MGVIFMAEKEGFVCIFAYGKNNCSARSSPRRQRSSALHLIVQKRSVQSPSFMPRRVSSVPVAPSRMKGSGNAGAMVNLSDIRALSSENGCKNKVYNTIIN